MHLAAANAAGYTAKQVLNFLARTYPQLSTHIQMASTAGYTADQISKYLSRYGPKAFKQFAKGQAGPQNVPYKEEETNPYIKKENTIREKEQIPEGLKTAGKVGLGLAGGALGAYALKRAAPAIVSSLFGGQSGQQTAENPVIGGPAVGQQPIQQIPAEKIPLPKGNVSNLFDQMGLGTQVKQMSSSQPPDVIAKILDQHMLSPSQKKWLKEQTNEPLENLVQQYLSQPSSSDQGAVEDTALPEQKKEQTLEQETPLQTPEVEQPAPEPIKPEIANQEENKKKSVFLPNGEVGRVISEKDGIAKVEVNGEIKHRKVSDLEEAPLDLDHLANLYEELTNAIPESERSSVMNFAGYDSNANELAFRPHGGALYVYKDIPQEFADKLQNAMFKAKTTGQNFYGAWAKGENSRFAGLSELIRQLQKEYGGRGKEYVRKYETVHDFLAIPEEAKRQKQRKNKRGKKT